MAKKNQPEAHDPETGEVRPELIDLASETLTGDIRDAMLDRIKALKKPWAQMSEADQRDLVHGLNSAAFELVRGAVEIIAQDGRTVIRASLESATVKDGIDAKIHLAKSDPMRHELLDAVGSLVLIAIASTDPYRGERKPAETDPDEPPLPGTGRPVADTTAAAAA